MRKICLSHKLSQKLLITPKLKQALYILQLPNHALERYLKKQIEENPLLQPPDKKNLDTAIKKILNSDTSSYQKNQAYAYDESDEYAPVLQKMHPQTQNLQDYLLQQLRTTFLNEDDSLIAEELINHIDNNGYLRISIGQFAKEHDLSSGRAETILKTIQSLDPPGIGAKNLQECLLIQLKANEQEKSLAYKIVQYYFKELSKKKYQIISGKLNIDMDKVKNAVREITSLNPRPGAVYSKNENADIIPDITVKPYKTGFRIMFNKKWQPKLKINPQYRKILQDPASPEGVKQFINEQLKNALWLIESLKKRQKNILKVAGAIVKIQKHAVFKDTSHIRPLNLKEIADKTNLHLSTVARIVANKYIATPERTFRLKDLFGGSIKSDRSAPVSNKYILSKIQNIILLENKEKPFTDRTITDTLNKEGFRISRRTIAKYRDKLKIPPSHLR